MIPLRTKTGPFYFSNQKPEIPTLPFWPEMSLFRRSFPASRFRSISSCFFFFFGNFPLVKEDNVFPASLVFLAGSFSDIFLWYLWLLLPLGHPSMSPRFLGAAMHWIASLRERFAFVRFDVGYPRQFSNECDLKMQ